MRRTRALAPLGLVAALAAATLGSPLVAATVAVLPVPRATAEPAVAATVDAALRAGLGERFALVGAEATRNALRRLRLRTPESASEEALAALARELSADLLVSGAVHDATPGVVPDLALSARLYDGTSGRVRAAVFHGRSGIDRGRWLDVGRIAALDRLAAVAASELLAALTRADAALRSPDPRAGRVALVPFTATVAENGVEVASAATEAVRAWLLAQGAELAEPGCVRRGLKSQRAAAWGQLGAAAREAIVAACGADRLLTGSIEQWESGGVATAPEPRVAVALRLLDGESGRIVWAGGREAGGWDRPGVFGLRRVHSRGVLLARTVESLGEKLLDAQPEMVTAGGRR